MNQKDWKRKERSSDRKSQIGSGIDQKGYVHTIFHKEELQIIELI